MPSILIVEKNGNIKPVDLKSYNEAELYKKAGLKTTEGFILQTSWSADIKDKKYNVHLYGKTTGKANYENKYEFPPPVDNVLFFGSCILVNIINGVVSNLNEKEWEQIYEFLYGGFEDIEESEEESEEDDIPRTKSGYAKDGFIVDDDEEDEDDDEDESEEEVMDDEEEEIYVKKSKKKPSKIAVKSAAKKPVTKSKKKVSVEKAETEIPETNYMDCTKELDYEEYT